MSSENGKGDTPRPIPNRKEYEANWDRIFKPRPIIKSLCCDAPIITAPNMREWCSKCMRPVYE